jgi:peptidoglycan/xylan/chitin deacetylase (PgdA/CDA1 family)
MVAPTRRVRRGAEVALAIAAAAQYVPSTVILGQWLPLRALPGGWCRWRGPDDGTRRVALTFDDGPDPDGTPAVLDELERLGLQATFFTLGSAARRYPELVIEVLARGHAIGTHGFDHTHHLLRPPGWAKRDLERAAAALADLGVCPRWFRPPYGQATGDTLFEARRRGWQTMLWSAWGREWATADPDEVSARVVCRVAPGSIVLLHDSDAHGPTGMAHVACKALPRVADALRDRNLRAVTLDELMGVPR